MGKRTRAAIDWDAVWLREAELLRRTRNKKIGLSRTDPEKDRATRIEEIVLVLRDRQEKRKGWPDPAAAASSRAIDEAIRTKKRLRDAAHLAAKEEERYWRPWTRTSQAGLVSPR